MNVDKDPAFTIYKNPVTQMKVMGHYSNADPASSCLGLNLSNLKTIGAHIEAVPPGGRSSLPHSHSKEDEMLYIISGSGSLWLDGHIHPLSAGDVVTFHAGTGAGHSVINDTQAPIVLFVVGTRLEDPTEDKLTYLTKPGVEIRKEQLSAKGLWWDDAPTRTLGPHPGEPANPRTTQLPEDATLESLYISE